MRRMDGCFAHDWQLELLLLACSVLAFVAMVYATNKFGPPPAKTCLANVSIVRRARTGMAVWVGMAVYLLVLLVLLETGLAVICG